MGLYKAWACSIQEMLKANVIQYGKTVSACQQDGEWRVALLVLKHMEQQLLKPNDITMNSAISACEKSEKWQWSLHLFETMHQWTLEENIISYTVTMSAQPGMKSVSNSLGCLDKLSAR